VTAHRHNATHRPPPSVVRLLTSDDRAHGDALPNVPPSTLHFLPTTLHALRIPARLEARERRHVRRTQPERREIHLILEPFLEERTNATEIFARNAQTQRTRSM
jgi:hypothetical protein